ncbi:MAG: adenylate/guanylate cyclase domain-containing protein [Planctomycetia bacterium]
MFFQKIKSARLRVWLLFFFIAISLFTGLFLTILSLDAELVMGRNFVRRLGNQISHNVVSQVEFSIEESEEFISIVKAHMEHEFVGDNSFERVARYLGDHLSKNTSLGSVFYVDAITGKSLIVSPDRGVIENHFERPGSINLKKVANEDGKLFVRQVTPDFPRKGVTQVMKYNYADYASKPLETEEVPDLDFRKRDWYKNAIANADSNTAHWTETYEFKFRGFNNSVFGITATNVIRDKNKNIVAVVGVDIPTDWLSNYLKNSIRKNVTDKDLHGFIFENRNNGGQIIIAHSDEDEVFPTRPDGILKGMCEIHEVKCPIVKDMMVNMPAGFKNTQESPEYSVITFQTRGVEMIGALRDVATRRPPNWVLCLYISNYDLFTKTYSRLYWNLFFTVVIMLGAVLVSLYLAWNASRPLEGLARTAEKIGKMEFNTNIDTNSKILEIRELSGSMNRMKIGLQSFTRYLPKGLLNTLFETGQGAKPGGVERKVTISFTDIVDFTHYAEKLPPNDLVMQLNEYLGCFSSVVLENEGTVDKYIGDAVMAFWNAPLKCQDHPFKACKAAIRGMQRLQILQSRWLEEGKPVFKARVGVNTGNAIVGNIGTEEHLNYTAVGDTINLASRLEGLNKTYGTKILITEATLSEVSDRVVFRPVDLVVVKGKGIRVMVYELLGLKGEMEPEVEQQSLEFAVAHKKYMAKDWSGALELFVKISLKSPADGLVALFMQRCRDYLQNPPGADWDGSQEFKTK